MKKLLRFILFIYITCTSTVLGQNKIQLVDSKEYIFEHAELAIEEMLKNNIPASITLGQAILESENGKSLLAQNTNNHFGIKCNEWNGEKYLYDDDKSNECFRVYNSVEESYKDHSAFLMSRPRYTELFQLNFKDYKSWAYGLKKAGYATDPNYAERLISIIEKNKLFLFDQLYNNENQKITSSR